MSHYAQLNENNLVVFVIQAKSDGKEDEFTTQTGQTWKQTSYNTRGGVHYTEGKPSADQSKALRFNYAGVGFKYDEELDAFIPPKPLRSWVLNEETARWEAPVPYPDDGKDYRWSEFDLDWVEIPKEEGEV